MAFIPSKTCRSCLKEDGSTIMYSLKDDILRQVYEEATTIKVPPDDPGPMMMCQPCRTTYVRWKRFREDSLKAEEFIQQHLGDGEAISLSFAFRSMIHKQNPSHTRPPGLLINGKRDGEGGVMKRLPPRKLLKRGVKPGVKRVRKPMKPRVIYSPEARPKREVKSVYKFPPTEEDKGKGLITKEFIKSVQDTEAEKHKRTVRESRNKNSSGVTEDSDLFDAENTENTDITQEQLAAPPLQPPAVALRHPERKGILRIPTQVGQTPTSPQLNPRPPVKKKMIGRNHPYRPPWSSLQRVNPDVPLQCPLCNVAFTTFANFQIHFNEEHENDILPGSITHTWTPNGQVTWKRCLSCNKTLDQGKSLFSHIIEQHMKEHLLVEYERPQPKPVKAKPLSVRSTRSSYDQRQMKAGIDRLRQSVKDEEEEEEKRRQRKRRKSQVKEEEDDDDNEEDEKEKAMKPIPVITVSAVPPPAKIKRDKEDVKQQQQSPAKEGMDVEDIPNLKTFTIEKNLDSDASTAAAATESSSSSALNSKSSPSPVAVSLAKKMPYACTECGRKFKVKAALLLHFSEVHPDKAITGDGQEAAATKYHPDNYCSLCGELLPSQEALKEHMETHFPTFHCLVCWKEFNANNNRIRHMKDVHRVTVMRVKKDHVVKTIFSLKGKVLSEVPPGQEEKAAAKKQQKKEEEEGKVKMEEPQQQQQVVTVVRPETKSLQQQRPMKPLAPRVVVPRASFGPKAVVRTFSNTLNRILPAPTTTAASSVSVTMVTPTATVKPTAVYGLPSSSSLAPSSSASASSSTPPPPPSHPNPVFGVPAAVKNPVAVVEPERKNSIGSGNSSSSTMPMPMQGVKSVADTQSITINHNNNVNLPPPRILNKLAPSQQLPKSENLTVQHLRRSLPPGLTITTRPMPKMDAVAAKETAAAAPAEKKNNDEVEILQSVEGKNGVILFKI